jgi:hypothetical protein
MATAWGSGTWGSNTWGGQQAALTGTVASGSVSAPGKSVTVALSGVNGSGFVGSTVYNKDFILTGVLASPDVGGVDPYPVPEIQEVHANALVGIIATDRTVSITGTSATGNVDNIVFAIPTTGVLATGSVDSVSMGERTVEISGVAVSGLVGTVAAFENPSETGIDAVGLVGSVGFDVAVNLTGVLSSGDVGSVTSSAVYEQAISGVSASGDVQSVSVGERLVAITGCPAMGNVGNIGASYWSLINDSQTPNWTSITNTENPNWVEIATV